MANSQSLTLYSRHGCHLCEEMAAGLARLTKELGLELVVQDVDSDPELAARFDDLVPVLMHGDREVARYRLDPRAVRAYLAQIR